MSAVVQPISVKTTPWVRRINIYLALVLVAFLIGFVPMWLQARESSSSFVEAERQLDQARIQNSLSAAVIDARRGDYEPARVAASNFFMTLRTEVDRGEASSYSQSQREGTQPLFAVRDEIITLLSRSDPASADRLSDLYVAYRGIMNR